MNEFDLPELYDAANTWGLDDDFYLSLAESSGGPVLDLGCGTGRLARAMADGGRSVVGVDRSLPMLRHAGKLTSGQAVGWVRADIRTFNLRRKFALVVMTSHVWQFLLTDDDQLACLTGIREHLAVDGQLAFETRNGPLGAEYKERHTRTFNDGSGHQWALKVESKFNAEKSIDSATLTYRNVKHGDEIRLSNKLRFTTADQLDERLYAAGLQVVRRYGDWDSSTFNAGSPEIITVAARL